MLEGLRWCGKALACDRRTRVADGVPSAARLPAGEAVSADAAAPIAAVAQHAQRSGFGSVVVFRGAFRAAAGAALQAGAGGSANSNR